MVTATRLLALAEYLATSADWDRFEVYDGVELEGRWVGIEHGDVAFEFGRLIGIHVADRGLGRLYRSDTRYILQSDPLRIVAPDFSFVRTDRLPPRQAWGRTFLIPPDLAVEILTTNGTGTRIEEKIRYYQDAGVPLILVVDMGRRAIIAHSLDGTRREYGITDILDGGAVLPDLRIPVAGIFR